MPINWNVPGVKKVTEQKKSSINWNVPGVKKIEGEEKDSDLFSKRGAARTARNVAAGMVDLVELPFMVDEALNYVPRYIGHKIAPNYINPPKFETPQFGQQLAEYIDRKTKGYTAPKNSEERWQEAITRGASSVLPGAGALKAAQMAGKAVSPAIRATFAASPQNLLGAAGSAAGTQYYLEDNDDPNMLGALAAGYMGAKVGSGLPGAARAIRHPKDAFAGALGRATGFDEPAYQRAIKSGLQPTLAMVSKKKWPTYVESIIQKLPFGAEKIDRAYQNFQTKLLKNMGAQKPEALIEKSHVPAKELAKKGAQKYHEKKSAAYRELGEEGIKREKEALTKGEKVSIEDLLKDLDEKYTSHLHTPEAWERFTKTDQGKLYTQLLHETRGKKIPYGSLEDYRASHVDLANKVRKEGQPNRHRIVEDLANMLGTKRHEFIAETSSKLTKESFKKAKELWHKYVSKDKDNLRKYYYEITGASDDATAFGKLLGNDPKYLHLVRNGLPKKEHLRLLDAIMSELSEGSPTKAHNRFLNLEEPVKQEILKLYPTPKSQADFKTALEFIGHNKKRLDDIANSSKTAHMNMAMNIGASIAAGTGALATKFDLTILMGLAATYGGIKGTAHLMTDPKFLDRVARVTKAKNIQEKANAAKMLVKYKPVDNMLKTIARNRGPLRVTIKASDKKKEE